MCAVSLYVIRQLSSNTCEKLKRVGHNNDDVYNLATTLSFTTLNIAQLEIMLIASATSTVPNVL